MKQEMSRQLGNWPLDSVVICNRVTRLTVEEVREAAKDGVYVHGLYLQGAAWDRRNSRLVEARAKLLFDVMPVINISAQLELASGQLFGGFSTTDPNAAGLGPGAGGASGVGASASYRQTIVATSMPTATATATLTTMAMATATATSNRLRAASGPFEASGGANSGRKPAASQRQNIVSNGSAASAGATLPRGVDAAASTRSAATVGARSGASTCASPSPAASHSSPFDVAGQRSYLAPVYKKPRRTALNYVTSLRLNCSKTADHWIMRGVALLCDIR
ncbi:unnamed protein product [Protopolystoma xenopodis]|uniref:Dynein heavy chain C-terminal domain-containing protein n=1 Tax=Protopolystoma xenopodis TaxID=117903 RepID=A0A448WM50_9PLAT|nr:unnamed protein product [Protopolystoma xenopodis]